MDMAVGKRDSARSRRAAANAREVARAAATELLGRAPRRFARKGGGLTNWVYAAESNEGERFILRLAPEARHRDYLKERWAMEQAAKAGAPVPDIVSLERRDGHAVMIQHAVTGEDATHHPDRLALLKEMGRVTKLIHGIKTKGYGQDFDPEAKSFDGAKNWAEYVHDELRFEERLDLLNLHRMLSRSQAARLEGVLREIAGWDVKPVLNHGDMRLKNVMAAGEPARIVAVLDWEFCSSNVAPYWDLSLALHDLAIDAKHMFLTGYGLGDEEIREMADVLKAFNIINYAPFVAKAAEEGDEPMLEAYRIRFSGALDLYSL